jgi:hypothetical protein
MINIPSKGQHMKCQTYVYIPARGGETCNDDDEPPVERHDAIAVYFKDKERQMRLQLCGTIVAISRPLLVALTQRQQAPGKNKLMIKVRLSLWLPVRLAPGNKQR